ncbi:serine/threonine-protein kinase [Nocardia rhamnosiphila]|uniref:serine/threonine-protein kinase n=1 Tax=Nocardia rhamnosiphila TaxID=426716 RepID=UPI00068D7C64|nr:serine/threonine-protein kinase [Nocardia rhamnosiphila]
MEGVEGTEFGRYRLLDPLGAGAMGEVHRAYDTGTERMVAVKVLSREFAQDTVYRRRFQREAQLVARLHEPHIVPIHDFGEIDGRLFLEMRLVEAPNLAALLADQGSLPAAEAVAVVAQIAAALDAAHSSGVVHRDVKPSNILITAEGFAYLIDFGIARSNQDTTLTRAGTMIGTLAYMAPERLTLDQVDARSDVYSLACVLYECLAGTKPYTGESVERQITAHLTERPPLPSAAGLPPAFDVVVARGLAKDPDQRYGSAGELAAAAQQALVPAGTPRTGTPAAVIPTVDDPPDDNPGGSDSPGIDSRTDNSPGDDPPSPLRPLDSGPATSPTATPPALFPPAAGPLVGLSPDDNPPVYFSPGDNASSAGFAPGDYPPAAGFAPGDYPPGAGFSPAASPPAVSPPTDRPLTLDTPNDIPPATRSRPRARTAAAVAALVTAVVSVSALALTREDTTTVTDAPVPTAPSDVPATAVPGNRAAEITPTPAPGLPGQEPPPSATHSTPMVPSEPPAVPRTTVAEPVPTTPAGDPVDQEQPAPPEPPLPTTSVAAPPTTTTAEPTGTSTSPTTTTDPETSTTTPSAGETTTATPPETTGTGGETSAAASSAITEQPRPRGSAISTSSGHVPATAPAPPPAAPPSATTSTPGPAATSVPVSPAPGSAHLPVTPSAPVSTSTTPTSTRLPAPAPAPVPSAGSTSAPAAAGG